MELGWEGEMARGGDAARGGGGEGVRGGDAAWVREDKR